MLACFETQARTAANKQIFYVHRHRLCVGPEKEKSRRGECYVVVVVVVVSAVALHQKKRIHAVRQIIGQLTNSAPSAIRY